MQIVCNNCHQIKEEYIKNHCFECFHKICDVLEEPFWKEKRERKLQKLNLWKSKNTEKIRAWHRTRRAKKRELLEKYTAEDVLYTKSLFNNKCANCGNEENLQIDHWKPLSKGHVLTRTNAVLLCRHCNCSKGNKLPENIYPKEFVDKVNKILEEGIRPSDI